MINLPRATFRLVEVAKLSASPDVRIGLSDEAMVKDEKFVPLINDFSYEIKVLLTTEVSFDSHLSKQLPARNYLPMALDLRNVESLGP